MFSFRFLFVLLVIFLFQIIAACKEFGLSYFFIFIFLALFFPSVL